MPARTREITIICVLAILQSLLRFFFMALALTGAELLQVEISSNSQLFINAMFFIIGVSGLGFLIILILAKAEHLYIGASVQYDTPATLQ